MSKGGTHESLPEPQIITAKMKNSYLVSLILLMVFIYLAIYSTTEIAARNTYLKFLNNRISNLESEYTSKLSGEILNNVFPSQQSKIKDAISKNRYQLTLRDIDKAFSKSIKSIEKILPAQIDNESKIKDIELKLISVVELFRSQIDRFKSENKNYKEREQNFREETKELAHSREKIENEIAFYKTKRIAINHLSNLGANTDYETMDCIKRMLLLDKDQVPSMPCEIKTIRIGTNLLGDGSLEISVNRELQFLKSDFLLAIAIISCGVIGTFITRARKTKNGNPLLMDLLLGFSTGFVVFLMIKGGKHVFLMEAQMQTFPFNPYSSSFAGLLAGMFTDTTYQILTKIMDSLSEKIEAVLKSN